MDCVQVSHNQEKERNGVKVKVLCIIYVRMHELMKMPLSSSKEGVMMLPVTHSGMASNYMVN